MRFKIFKFLVSICLAAILIPAAPGAFAASAGAIVYPQTISNQGEGIIKNKEEAVYANLASNGSVNAIYVINHFVLTGSGNITDYGGYSSVKNLTSTEPLVYNGDSVRFQAEEGDFYYQGNVAATDLPWSFDITYYLDGVGTVPQDLPGRSGKLEIHMSVKQNEKIYPAFFENYMLQISMTLDTGKCRNIEAPGSTIADSGKNTVITYMVMPGDCADLSLSSTVKDFAMSGIQISAMTFKTGIDMPDTGELFDKMSSLSKAVDSLNKGVKELNDGVAGISEGTAKLADGSAEFGIGLSQLSTKSDQFTNASSQINSALAEIVNSMDNSSGGIDMNAFAQLPAGLDDLSQGLRDISGGLTQLIGSLDNMDKALDASINGIPDISRTELESLSGSSALAGLDQSQRSTFNKLLAGYTASQGVKAVYYGPNGNDGIKTSFASMKAGLGTMSGSIDTISRTLSGMSAEIKNASDGSDLSVQMKQLEDGLTQLSNNYGQFNSGLIQYTNGVKELSANYRNLNTGLFSFSDVIAGLHDGTKKLYAGTSELNGNLVDLPETMQTEIDSLIKDYDKSDFKPVSFTSEKNTSVSLVQFVFKTADIELNRETTAAPRSEPVKTTFWDRLLALFHPRK